MTRLQWPKVPFVFDDDARRSFQALETAMLMAPVLSIYDPTLPTRVTTDASGYGIGAVLEQHDGDDWHPVEYFSHKVPPINSLDDARKELLAFVMAHKRWRHFLLGRRRFTWVTDNNPLTYYKTQDTMSSTIGRWMYFIDQFDFTPKHLHRRSLIRTSPRCMRNYLRITRQPATIALPTGTCSSTREARTYCVSHETVVFGLAFSGSTMTRDSPTILESTALLHDFDNDSDGSTSFPMSLGIATLAKFVDEASPAIAIPTARLKGASSSAALKILGYIPGISQRIQEEKAEAVKVLKSSIKTNRNGWITKLPEMGLGSEVLKSLQEMTERDSGWKGQCSGTVYFGADNFKEHMRILTEAYSMFAHTNPLHSSVFPSVPRLEAEVVAMTASTLNGDVSNGVCGNVTSGGTESILMAVKATRDYMKATRGITEPEIVIPVSAHAAYHKAGQYFSVRVRMAAVDAGFRADVEAMSKLINSNTIMIVASAPTFPQGVIDPVEDIAALARSANVCLHVDCCLGGFVLPFARKLGYPIPPFDFSVPGVTSVSADIHKYGLGPKGTSVVLYNSHELRKHAVVAVSTWSGGLYASMTIPGSRPGGLVASAWAAMMAVGGEGYLENAKKLMATATAIRKGIEAISDLHVLGRPDMTVVSFGSDTMDIFRVNDEMVARGWKLVPLHLPACLHICVTLQHVGMVEKFLADLEDSVQQVRNDPDEKSRGLAPIYGAAASIPNRGLVADMLVTFMDESF
ncbi:hypothetical protein CBR_g49954 [Chara braunii]|uniref:sphinganine-1-phosphate aldolase n=1 Tax=Chara braunii TaxID=69332 RepID=A0A388K521_CHABU|nr:hypothetical protein CBR_g49954 [Chara braunii]|eukprot:GBG65158.1 hypothetical protein CBR_g49954 [Chara braunii]